MIVANECYESLTSTAMTSAFAMLPAVNILDPLRPLPVLASGRSPFCVRRRVKNVVGTDKENNGSSNVFISTLVGVLLSSTIAIAGSRNIMDGRIVFPTLNIQSLRLVEKS